MANSSFSNELMLTVTQSLQLVGLFPSLFVIVFLLTLLRSNKNVIIPILYFISLICGFALPLLDLYPDKVNNLWLRGFLQLTESLLPALAFLLIYQFINNSFPKLLYWFVLFIPTIGGGAILYADLLQFSDSCLPESCLSAAIIGSIYRVISSSLIFMLLLVYFARNKDIHSGTITKNHKYWLVVSLIVLHLSLLAADLAASVNYISLTKMQLVSTVLRLAFIYLVITALLRVFYPNMIREIVIKAHYAEADKERDQPYIDKITLLLNYEKIYKEERLNRAVLAEKIETSEHNLSRIINQYFGKNFNELVNEFRIDESKRRLIDEPNRQITDIALDAGFNSIASFNRVFKEQTGLSPTEFRTRWKNMSQKSNSHKK